MFTTFSSHLQAEDLTLNRRRAYQLEVGRDLFGHWRVEVTFGRIGARGRTLSYHLKGEDEARRLARACLRRRASAPRRLGVPYRELARYDPDGWLAI